MGILSRAINVGRSQVNSAISWASNPHKKLVLLIQDMEDTLVKARSAAITSFTEKKELERRIEKIKNDIDDWQQKAEVAVQRDRDDLATEALRAKARNVAMLGTLEQQLDTVAESLARQGQDMNRLQSKLQEAKARERTTRTLQRSATTRLWLRRKTYDHRINDAFAQLGEVESTLDELEGRVESYDLGRSSEVSSTLGRLAIENAASSELTELKNRLAGQSALTHSKE